MCNLYVSKLLALLDNYAHLSCGTIVFTVIVYFVEGPFFWWDVLEGPAYRAGSCLVSGNVNFETSPKRWDCMVWLGLWIILSFWECGILILVAVPIWLGPSKKPKKAGFPGQKYWRHVTTFHCYRKDHVLCDPSQKEEENMVAMIFPHSIWCIF